VETFASGPKSLRKLSNCCKHGSDIHVLKMAPVLLEVGLEGPRVEERRLGNVVFILEEVREAWGGVENQKGFELHFGGGGQS
jgi:hypothetical protein